MTKKLKITELNEAYQKVINWFFAFSTKEIGLSDLAEAVNISKTTANKVVNQLVQEGFLNLEVLGKIWRISCNQKHQYNTTRKIAFNLTKVYESRIIEKIHKTIKNPKAIILFGSYRKGDDTEESDIDIAIEVFDNKDLKITELEIPKLGYRKNIKINLQQNIF